MKVLYTLLAAGAFCALAGTAQATLVVDTGAGPDALAGGLSLDGTDSLAARITIGAGQPALIDSVKLWLADPTAQGGTFTVALFDTTGFGGLPGTQLFAAQGVMDPASGNPGWYGVSGEAWNVAPGNYWVGFEVLPADTLANGVAPEPTPGTLPAYAFDSGDGNGFRLTRVDQFGLQVDAVPEPGTWALCGLGLAGLAFARRRA